MIERVGLDLHGGREERKSMAAQDRSKNDKNRVRKTRFLQ
jgi:hypothetical protein